MEAEVSDWPRSAKVSDQPRSSLHAVMEAEASDLPRFVKEPDPPSSSQYTASANADDEDSVVNVSDPGVEEESANPTLARFQGSWLTHTGGWGRVEGAEVLRYSGETALLVSPEPNIAKNLEGDERYTGTLHWEKGMIYWNDRDEWCLQNQGPREESELETELKDQVTELIDQFEELQLGLGTMKMASNERCERDQRESQGTQTDAESEMPRDQRESQTAAETSGSSAETTEDATVGDDRTTHEANTVAEGHSALQAENQNLLEYAQSLQQHVDQLHASLRENDERH